MFYYYIPGNVKTSLDFLEFLESREMEHWPEIPANIYLFKSTLDTLEKGVKYVQS